MEAELWIRVMYARAWVRLKSIYGEPLWIVMGLGFPLLTSFGFAFLYRSVAPQGGSNLVVFAVLGGIMVSFWSNVLWSMASQFYWDKQEGLFEIYLVSPAPMTAILVGMSLGGILGTVPSAALVAVLGWAVFQPQVNPNWGAVGLAMVLTVLALYSLGMLLSSLFLAYGREAESLNHAVEAPVSLLSGLYYPSIGPGSPFPVALQAIASVIPLTLGMDSLRHSVESNVTIYVQAELVALAAATFFLLYVAKWSLAALRERGRREGTLTVRMK